MGKITPTRSIPIVSSAKNGLQYEEPVPSDKFCLTCIEIRRQCRSEFTSSRALPVSLLPSIGLCLPGLSVGPSFRVTRFQTSQDTPKIRALSFIRRVIRQLVYNIFRCNDDLTSTDLSLPLSLSLLPHAYHPPFYNRFSVSRNIDKMSL